MTDAPTPPPSALDVIERLGLQAHPMEGGFFKEIYRSEESLGDASCPGRYDGDRCYGTAIYYLLTPSTFSEIHRLQSDEIFHFYLGDPVDQLHLHPDGGGHVHVLGTDLDAGQRPQLVVPRGVWQGSRLVPDGEHGFALLGTTVCPGFEMEDYESGDREALVASYPEFVEMIEALTHRVG